LIGQSPWACILKRFTVVINQWHRNQVCIVIVDYFHRYHIR
jgi:hypothetical protein